MMNVLAFAEREKRVKRKTIPTDKTSLESLRREVTHWPHQGDTIYFPHFDNRTISQECLRETPDFANPHRCGDAIVGDRYGQGARYPLKEPRRHKACEKIHVEGRVNVTKCL